MDWFVSLLSSFFFLLVARFSWFCLRFVLKKVGFAFRESQWISTSVLKESREEIFERNDCRGGQRMFERSEIIRKESGTNPEVCWCAHSKRIGFIRVWSSCCLFKWSFQRKKKCQEKNAKNRKRIYESVENWKEIPTLCLTFVLFLSIIAWRNWSSIPKECQESWND